MGGGGGGGHSNYSFYSIKLCVMFNFSLHHNVLCLSFVVVLYSMCRLICLYAVIKMVPVSLMKEVVTCDKSLRLKSPLKVNRPLEFIVAP